MKKIVLVAALALATVAGFAQTSLSVEAGANISTLHSTTPGEDSTHPGNTTDKNYFLANLRAGVSADFHLAKNFYFSTGIFYSRKGSGQDDPQLQGAGVNGPNEKDKLQLDFLEVPLYLQYKVKGFTFGVGGYVAYAVSGRIKVPLFEYNSNGNVVKTGEASVSVFNKDVVSDPFRRFDAGPAVMLAYSLPKNLYVKVAGQLGVTNLYGSDTPGELKTRNIAVTVGYTFWKTK